jgi:hypothetical protein
LLQAERRARLIYRRNVDQAYEPVDQAVDIIAATGKLAALKSDIESLHGSINSQTSDKASDSVGAALNKINTVPGTGSLRDAVAKIRRSLRGVAADKDAALKSLDDALKVYAAELAWRQRAAQQLLPGLRAYDEAIRDTIGLRKQEKLPHAKAVELAACLAHHRDISLYF